MRLMAEAVVLPDDPAEPWPPKARYPVVCYSEDTAAPLTRRHAHHRLLSATLGARTLVRTAPPHPYERVWRVLLNCVVEARSRPCGCAAPSTAGPRTVSVMLSSPKNQTPNQCFASLLYLFPNQTLGRGSLGSWIDEDRS